LARKEWNAIVPELERLGIVCEIEGKALAGYCQSYKRWTEAEEEIDRRGILIVVEEKDKDGNFHVVGAVKNPAVNVADAMMKQMRAFLVEFGLTPASRSRVAVLPVHSAEVTANVIPRLATNVPGFWREPFASSGTTSRSHA
jgi:P27 family predicted phage terminase small subunit